VLPVLYLRGISTKDFEPALAEFFGSEAGLSASTIQRLTREWSQELTAFQQRDRLVLVRQAMLRLSDLLEASTADTIPLQSLWVNSPPPFTTSSTTDAQLHHLATEPPDQVRRLSRALAEQLEWLYLDADRLGRAQV
jgi:hypothetical protein